MCIRDSDISDLNQYATGFTTPVANYPIEAMYRITAETAVAGSKATATVTVVRDGAAAAGVNVYANDVLQGQTEDVYKRQVSHGAAAADFQSAFGIQLPKCILAAASAGDDPHGSGTGNIGNAELFCIGLRIGVLTDGQCHIGDSVEEDVSADLDCAVGNLSLIHILYEWKTSIPAAVSFYDRLHL